MIYIYTAQNSTGFFHLEASLSASGAGDRGHDCDVHRAKNSTGL